MNYLNTSISLLFDPLSLFFLFVILLVSIPSAIYSIGYLKGQYSSGKIMLGWLLFAGFVLYDIQRFGVDFVASPRHADALLVTGPVSKNMTVALKKTYGAMPQPKFVISLGNCAADGWVFKNSYYIEGGVSKVLPVHLHIPGCPPEPFLIIKYLLAFLKQTS